MLFNSQDNMCAINVGEGCTKWAPQPKWVPARLPLLTMVRVIVHYWC